jgi:hypothetical protein
MSNNHKDSQRNHAYNFSAKSPNTDGKLNTSFEAKLVATDDLRDLFTQHNYSHILWDNGKRQKSNFSSADGVILDFDHDIRIDDVLAQLETLNLSFALITSKSHTPEEHHFHLFLPFSRSITSCSQYEDFVDVLRQTHFPNSDRAAKDGARFFYYSPDTAEYHADFNRSPLDVDKILAEHPPQKRKAAKGNKKTYPASLLVTLEDGSQVEAGEITEKTKILCPFHDDGNSSAFIKLDDNTGRQFIRCSTCDATFWLETQSPADRCRHFWSHSDSIYEAGFCGTSFSFEKVGKEKFFLRAGVQKPEEDEYLAFLAQTKHLHNLGLRESHGMVDLDAPEYEVLPDVGKTIVRIPAIAEDVADNAFIEDYLKRTFGQYTPFIKEYLAVYCFTNFKRLPTIVLKGKRGTGKNTFAEMVGAIYESLSQPIADLAGNFNPYAEKKLGIVDETLSKGRLQYADLKKLSGQAEFEVNNKYKAQYKAKNNLNLILLSNAQVPITVAANEIPQDTRNNQFFVFEMHPFTGKINGDLASELRKRLGHYIRTELRAIFTSLPAAGFRYSIDVPITSEERKLFENNADDIDHLIEMIVDEGADCMSKRNNVHATHSEVVGKYADFIQAGKLPIEYLKEHTKGSKVRINDLVVRLQEAKWCLEGKPGRAVVAGNRKTCLLIDQKAVGAVISGKVVAQSEAQASLTTPGPLFDETEKPSGIGENSSESPKKPSEAIC